MSVNGVTAIIALAKLLRLLLALMASFIKDISVAMGILLPMLCDAQDNCVQATVLHDQF